MDHDEQAFEPALGRMAAAIEGDRVTLREN
jgi:hypothetical protein